MRSTMDVTFLVFFIILYQNSQYGLKSKFNPEIKVPSWNNKGQKFQIMHEETVINRNFVNISNLNNYLGTSTRV